MVLADKMREASALQDAQESQKSPSPSLLGKAATVSPVIPAVDAVNKRDTSSVRKMKVLSVDPARCPRCHGR